MCAQHYMVNLSGIRTKKNHTSQYVPIKGKKISKDKNNFTIKYGRK